MLILEHAETHYADAKLTDAEKGLHLLGCAMQMIDYKDDNKLTRSINFQAGLDRTDIINLTNRVGERCLGYSDRKSATVVCSMAITYINHDIENWSMDKHHAIFLVVSGYSFSQGFHSNFFDCVGVSEAAYILGWNKQKVATYISRGVFPEPIQRLASGPIWTRKQIEDYRDSRQ